MHQLRWTGIVWWSCFVLLLCGGAAAQQSFENYEALRRSILNEKVNPSTIDLIKDVATDKTSERLIISSVTDAMHEKRANLRKRHLAEAYKHFIKMPASAEIIFDYIKYFSKFGDQVPQVVSKRGKGAWCWGFLGDSILSGFLQTRDATFLDLFVGIFSHYKSALDTRTGRVDDLRGANLPAWGSELLSNELRSKKTVKGHELGAPVYTTKITHNALILLPAIRFSQIVLSDSELTARYGELAKQLIALAEGVIAVFGPDYRVSDPGLGYYVMPHDGRVEPLNHTHTMAALLVSLYRLTGDSSYRTMIEEIGRTFLQNISLDSNGSYSWPYRPTISGEDATANLEAEALWKGRSTLLFPLAAHPDGLVFTSQDMLRFAKTLTDNINLGSNVFNINISRRNIEILKRENVQEKHWSRAAMLAGWIFLDEYDRDVRSIIEEAVAFRTDIFPKGWFTHCQTVQAYAHRLTSVQDAWTRANLLVE
jgi:hypothetical protein